MTAQQIVLLIQPVEAAAMVGVTYCVRTWWRKRHPAKPFKVTVIDK